MKKVVTLLVFTLPVVLSPISLPRNTDAFNDKAHEALTQRATSVSSLDNILKTGVGFEFPDGINQLLDGKIATRHIQDGALLEDSLAPQRVRHHFHNPRLNWDQAGLRPPGSQLPVGQSSVVWSQNTNQGLVDGGKRSWHQARESYFIALTSTSQVERNKWFATTFRLLGHAIHHVQDAAAPSHTRNDSHPSKWGIGNADPFHEFAERPEILGLINNPNLLPASPLDTSFLSNQASSDSRYPVPISRLLDVNAGDIGALALGNGNGIGIAEYSNANFFSDDTIFPETFPYPGLANVQLSIPELDPTTGKKKTYLFFKPGFGETNYRLAQASSLRNISGTNVPTDIGLDYKVFSDYAYKLFPRALGYSAGLIDYFFRGYITSTATETPVVPYADRTNMIPVENLRVAVDSGSEQGGQGTMVLVLTYSHQSGTSETFPPVLVSNPISINVSSQTPTVDFSFGSLPYPVTVDARASYVGKLVYRGPLGQEADAVVVGGYCLGGPTYYHFFHTFDSVVTGQEVAWLGGSEECTVCNEVPELCAWLMARRPSANW